MSASRVITRSVTRTARKGTDGAVRAVRFLSDRSGRALVGGLFSRLGSSAQPALALVKANGAADPTFQAGDGASATGATSATGPGPRGISVGTNGGTAAFLSLALQRDGKIIIGGLFDRTDPASRKNLARLNADGGVDTTYDPGQGANASVRAVAVQPDNKAVIAGGFNSVNNVPRGGVARLLGGASDVTPAVSVVGTPARGGFVVSRPDGAAGAALTVLYHNGGSAIRDQDYVAFPGTLNFAAGQSETVIPVTLRPGANRNRKVKVFLDPAPNGEYQIGKAQSKVFLSEL